MLLTASVPAAAAVSVALPLKFTVSPLMVLATLKRLATALALPS